MNNGACTYSVVRKSKKIAAVILRVAAIVAIALGIVTPPSQQAIARPTAVPTPNVSVSITPAAPFIGNAIAINATFSNTVDTGYGPYMDVFLPVSGADGTAGGANDGITFLNANYLGAPVSTNVLNCPAGSSVAHPLTGLSVACPAQPAGLFSPFVWRMVVITLPFGSFVPGQPDATVTINAQVSNLADLNVGLPIQVRSGFMFGADPLDNPVSDPPIIQPTPTAVTLSPNLITLVKTYSGPEDETATGPNYEREYTVTATIAPGQTVSSLVLTDNLPNNMQFLTMVSPSNASCTTLPNTTIPGGTITCPVTQVGNTASMTFRYFIPLDSNVPAPVINAASGDDVLSQNTASATGSWKPIDLRDSLTPVSVNPVGYEHILTDKSIAIQKGVANATDSTNSPNDLLRYTLRFQVSDYFAFNDISIADIISDGQHFYNAAGYVPTLTVTEHGSTSAAAAFDGANFTVDTSQIGNTGPGIIGDGTNGSTTVTFHVSDELISRSLDDNLIGGCVPNAGVGAGNFPVCSVYNHGATTGTITFYTQIQENFTDTYPSGDPSVDQGDILVDSVTIDGALLSVEDAATPTGSREADGSSASVNIPYGVITKSIYAVGGITNPTSPVSVSPGDTITYRVTYTLPTSDFEALSITDYLPLPVFTSTEVTTFNASDCGIPAAGTSCYGSTDTYHSLSNTPTPITPTLSTNAGSNSVIWTYGNYDAPNNQPSRIDLLFTVTVNNQPFADGLFLTNQAHTRENSTNAGSQAVDGIVQILLQEPVVNIKKGVVWSDKASATFTPAPAAPVTFNGSGCPAFSSGTVTTSSIDSNLSGVDADDTVKMAVVLENSGRNAAYDMLVSDSLPAGLTFIPGSVCVTDGAGNALAYTGTLNNFISTGITLTSLARGKLSDGTPVATGANIAIITYNVTVDATAEASHVYTNTATLASYAGVAGGPNHIPGGRTDTATVTLTPPLIAKSFISTEISNAYNSNTQVVIGEYASYQVVVTVPEGVTQNARIIDTLDAGLAYVDLTPATLSTGLSVSGSTTPVITNSGRTVTFNLGTVTNSNTDDAVAETLTLVYRVVTLDILGNQAGTLLNNSAALSWTGGSATRSAANVTVIEPTVNTTKVVSVGPFDAGDTATFTVTLANPASNSTTAHDVTWSDAIPLGLTYVPSSLAYVTACAAATPPTLDATAAPTLTASGGLFQPGQSCQITFQVTIDYTGAPGQTLTNTAQTRWTSLAGSVVDRSSYNTSSDERDGTGGLLGGGQLNDYRTQGSANVVLSTVAVQKYLVATSEAHTINVAGVERVTIGEILRYRLRVLLPEGTSTNFQIGDRLPPGMIFLDDDTAKAAFVFNGTGISSTAFGTLPVPAISDSNCFLTGASADATTPAIPAACPTLADFNIGSSSATTLNSDPDLYTTGIDPYFKLGTLTNNDNDSDAEYVILEFNALVDNTSAGSNDAGDPLANDFRVYISTVYNNGTSNVVNVRVAEPVMTVDKFVNGANPVDAGDPFIYRITFANSNTGTPATAFDIVMTDTVNNNLTINSASILSTTQGATCQGGTAFTDSISTVGQLITVNASCLDVSQSVTVEIAATVNADAPSSLTIPNTARITWTSLPGSKGTTSNSTGSSTPGDPGTDNGERTGDNSGGRNWNDYAVQDTENISLNPVSVVKNAPTPTIYTIGQTITYPIVVTLHEGTTRSLRVTDTLPQGLEYLTYSVDTTGFTGTVTISPTVGTVGNAATDPSTSTFTFGDTTVTANPTAGTSSFTINVTARVLDISQNQIGDTKTNSATAIYFDPDGAGSDVTLSGGSQTITIAEPRIVTTKDVLPLTGVDAGDTVTYTVRFANNGTSTAYDVTALDVLAQGVTYNNASITCVDNASVAVPVTLSNNTTTLGFDGSPVGTGAWDIPVNGYIQCTYTATASSGIYLDGSHTNTIDADWTGLDGVDPYERTYTDVVVRTVDGTQDTYDAFFTSPSVTILKSVTPASATIGETLTFTLTINGANGALRNLVLTDQLPAGLIFNNDTVVTGLTGLLTPTVSGLNDGSTLVTITWPAADVTKTADSATLVFTARVADVASNHWASPNMTLTNTFLLDHQTAQGVAAPQLSATATPAIVEPRITTTKSVNPASGVEAGDTLTYTVVFANTGSSTAFDVTAHDVLAQGVSYISGSASCLPALVALIDNGTTLDFDSTTTGSWDIAAGGSITCTYDVTADADLYLDGNHTNTIDADWSSMNGSVTNERVYDDTVTRIVDGTQDTATAVFTATGVTLDKTVNKTSATIGEVVTYTLTINGPNGLLRNLSISDTLDAGWIFNNDTTFTGLSVQPVPTFGTNDGTLPVTVTWNFGDVKKSAASATLTYSVTVANESVTTTGDTLGNAASLTYTRVDGSPAGPLTDSTTTGIVEPDLNIVKSIVTAPYNSIGSPVSYSLLLTHTAASTSDAYDVVISDTVPTTYLDFTPADNTALTVTFTPAACGAAINNSTPATDTVSISIAHLPMGCQAEVNFTAILKQEITPGLLVTNSAGTTYSTLPGTPAEERGYTDSDSTAFTTSNPDIEKVLDSSSITQTTGSNLAIGETATFMITVHIPEGTTTTLQVIDTLPATMAYVTASALVSTTTDRTGTALPVPTITEDAGNHRVTFDFTGPIVVIDLDPLTEDDTFEITLQAVVLNDVNNQMGGTLTNRVTVQADGGLVLRDSAVVTLVEPDLNITKSVDNTAPTPEEEITFTLDLTHTVISSEDAFDVVIKDTLPTELDFVAGSATMPAGWNFALNGKVVTFTGNLSLLTTDTPPLPGSAKFTYKAVVNGATPILTALTNTAVTTWTSMPGTTTEERHGPDVVNELLNNYKDEASQTVTFQGVELVITKADSPTTITPSLPLPALPNVLRYTINYSNTGDIDATNVVITETVPLFTRFNKLTSTGGDTLPPTGWDCADLALAGTTCHFNLASLAAGASGSLDFDVIIDETVPAETTQILNTVTIAADEKEPIYTNNTDDEDTPLTAAPDMAISKTDGVSVVSPGIELTYTLTVRNNGSEGATGVVVTDTLPYHVTYVAGSAIPAFTTSATVPAPIPTDPDQTVFTWNVAGEVAAGAELTFSYRVLVEDPMPVGVTEIVNTATVVDDGTNGEDPTDDNNSSDTDYLATLPNTNLSKILAGTSEGSTLLQNVAIGEALTYRVTFVLPPGDLPAMTLTDSLPQGLAFGNCLSITSSSPLVTNNITDQFVTTCQTPLITAEPTTSLEPVNQGRNVVFDFGDVNNSGAANATLTLDYIVYVLDSAENLRDLDLVNLVHWKWGTDNDLLTQSDPVTIVEPSLSIGKTVDPTSGPSGTIITYTLTVAHTPESNATAFDVLVLDTLPKGMDYIPGTLQAISGPTPDLLEEAGAPLLQIGWNVLLAKDGLDNPTTVVIQYQARINDLARQGSTLINAANVAWSSLPDDVSLPQTPNNPLSTERFYDPGDAVNIYGATASAEFVVPKEDVAPATGFAPGVVTDISGIPQVRASDLGNITLEIPSLGVKLPIVGIPANMDGWNLTWLGAKAGWLQGTAYPTREGNTALTAHVYLPNGKPGPFVNLKNLRWGNRFYILSNGMRYTYEVRITARVSADDETILAHEKLDWVTLITCAGYDKSTDTYQWRDIVKAVLIKVEEE